MQIYFINYHKLIDSSGIHIHFLANELEQIGVKCNVCIPWIQEYPEIFGTPKYRTIPYKDIYSLFNLGKLHKLSGQIIIHAWTPRENVRQLTNYLVKQTGAPYFVHLEDNEPAIASNRLNLSFDKLQNMPPSRLDRIVHEDIIHPLYFRDFLKSSAGITCIIKTLETFVPGNVKALTIWPACEPDFFDIPTEPDKRIRELFKIKNDEILIVYTGNLHASNTAEITELYKSIKLLNNMGHKVKLIRTGSNYCDYRENLDDIIGQYIFEAGSVPSSQLLDYIAAANILVQPGESNEFNNYRFPSKLPMYLASGRPVILPPSNLGHYLKDKEECLFLANGTAEEIVRNVGWLINHPEETRRMGQAGRNFAKNNFNWKKSATELLDFYKTNIYI